MRGTVLNVVTSLLAFVAGITAALSWVSGPIQKPAPPPVNVQVLPAATPTPPVSKPVEPPAPKPVREAALPKGLSVKPVNIQLKSERLRYEINVTYPQIAGSDAPYIRKLNQHLKQLVTAEYQWQLHPSKEDVRRWKVSPEPSNSLDLDYGVTLANDSLLSIGFFGYSYGIGAAHAVEFSFAVNYDLINHRELQLSDIFKPQTKYLRFLAAYCRNDLMKSLGSLFDESPAPVTESFKSWTFTNEGITINFDSCSVTGCSGGPAYVDISYNTLKPWLRDRFHAKSQR